MRIRAGPGQANHLTHVDDMSGLMSGFDTINIGARGVGTFTVRRL